jgi:putative addiction module component (TIGR02574 family)
MGEFIIEISKLSVAHRLAIVQAILSTIEVDTALDSDALTPAQIVIIEQRAAELARGLVKPVSWEDVEKKIFARYGNLEN